MYLMWFILTVMSTYNFQATCKVQVSEKLECLQNKLWKVYSEHFYFATTIRLKILVNENVSYLNDVTDDVLHNIQLSKPGKAIQIERYIAKNNIISIDLTSLKIEINKIFTYSITSHSDTYRYLRSVSDPEEVYLLLAWNEQDIYQILEQHSSEVLPKPRALYAILLMFGKTEFCQDIFVNIGVMLKMLWNKFHILNTIVQAPCSCNPDDIYVYEPFILEKRTWGAVRINKVDNVMLNRHLIINYLDQLNGFPLNISLFGRMPTSMHYVTNSFSTLKVSKDVKNITGFYGLDANVVAEASKYLNFTVLITNDLSAYYGKILRNGSITGSLGQVVRKEVALSANSRFIADYGTEDFEFTQPLTNEEICVIVPKSKRRPAWLAIFKCFKWKVWLLIGAVILSSSFILYLYSKMKSINTDVTGVFLKMFSVFISIPVNINPHSGMRGILLITCMTFNVIITGIYQGNLTKAFSSATYFPEINTLEELDDSNLQISTTLWIFNHQSDIFKRLQKKVIDSFGQQVTSLDKAAYLRTSAALERKSDAKMILNTYYINEKGEPLLHIVKECPTSYFLAYIVPKGSAFLPKFNFIIQRFLEGGFIEKWNNDVARAIITERQMHAGYIGNSFHRKLTLVDIQFAFFFIISGYILSTMIFVLEKYLLV